MKRVKIAARDAVRRITVSARTQREKGAITVAETLIALAVGSAVLAGVFAGLPALQEARHASSGLNGLSQLVTTIRATFGPRNSFSGLDTALAQTLAGFPRSFLEGSAAKHPWGGAITVAAVTGNTRQFEVTFDDVTESGCTSIVASTLDFAEEVDVGGKVIGLKYKNGSVSTDADAVTATVAAECDDEVDIKWTFSA